MDSRDIMTKIGDNSYGDIYAEAYDDLFQERDDLTVVSSVLATLACGGSALEFGIGSRRISLPFVQRGVKVSGIDNSSEMLSRLREKPGSEQVTTVLGDCTADAVLDPAKQLIRMQQVALSSSGITMRPNRLRFIYPAEMNLMARLSRLRLRDRWNDWSEAPFGASSETQIAVYGKSSDQSLK